MTMNKAEARKTSESLNAVGSPVERGVGRLVENCEGMSMLGLKIVPHPLARDRRTEFKVTPWATRDKKRKNWRVMRIEIDRPGCWQVGDTLYMHPDLIARLPRTA